MQRYCLDPVYLRINTYPNWLPVEIPDLFRLIAKADRLCSTGRILHALGNVRFSQGSLEDSFSYHRRALLQFKSTLGNNHHRTADLYVKVASHHLRLKHWELAKCVRIHSKSMWHLLTLIRALLKQSLRIYDDRKVYFPERTRAKFNMAKVLRAQNKLEAVEAEREFMLLYRKLCTDAPKAFHELRDADLDRLVVFWSR